MQCRRCKAFFNYDKYYGICPQCAYFNRPPGMEEVDLFEDDERFRRDDYQLPQMERIHKELHNKYDSNREPHKKAKTVKHNPEQMQPNQNGRSTGRNKKSKNESKMKMGTIFYLIFAILAVLFALFSNT